MKNLTKTQKLLIFEIFALIIIILLTLCVFYVDMDLKVFQLISKDKVIEKYSSVKNLNFKLNTAKGNYTSVLGSLESSKENYKKQKEQYDAISQETLDIIKEANTEEQYTIDFMWVKLGNYASQNNLTIGLVEPNGTGSSTSTSTQTSTATPTATGTTQQKETMTSINNPTPSNVGSSSTSSSSGEFRIKVRGSYIDVSSFIFDLENDSELRFRLDNIEMKYAESNTIDASFMVKNLKIIK